MFKLYIRKDTPREIFVKYVVFFLYVKKENFFVEIKSDI